MNVHYVIQLDVYPEETSPEMVAVEIGQFGEFDGAQHMANAVRGETLRDAIFSCGN